MPAMSQEGLDRVRPASDVLLKTLPDGNSVLLEMGSEACFGLNAIGTVLREAIASRTPLETTVREVTSRYDVAADRLRSDLTNLLAQLIDAGLVEVVDE